MKDKKIILIIILVIILVAIIAAYVKQNSNTTNDFSNMKEFSTDFQSNNNENKKQKEESKTTLKSSGEIKSALIEKVEPHASYYLEEICVEKNQFVKTGENILKYTNGEYLTAPYDCSITDLSLPDLEGKILNSHYVELSSNNVLSVTMNVDETKISDVKVGEEAKISVPTLEKEYVGYVTNISSTASNGKFKVTIEFENDGNIKLGMT